MSKTKSKSKTSKTKKSDSKSTDTKKTAVGGAASKAFSKRRAEDFKSKGTVKAGKARKVVSGRTRLGEVPDALNIYKGE